MKVNLTALEKHAKEIVQIMNLHVKITHASTKLWYAMEGWNVLMVVMK
jgi:hypothetical protein